MIYFKHFDESVVEGGGSRNQAFYNFFVKEFDCVDTLHVASGSKMSMLISKLKVIKRLLFLNGEKIFIHLGGLFFLFSFLYKIFGTWWIMSLILSFISKRNRLIIEVNDLVFEQSVDLEFCDDLNFEEFQKQLFSLLDTKFVFASHEMLNYVVSKYNVNKGNCLTIINGSISLDCSVHKFDVISKFALFTDTVKYIYVGTLNKGRQIEELIDVFDSIPNVYLFLMGPGGEWIDSIKSNVVYLGAYNESVALDISSQCDVGVIPYDHDRFYYNLCYPTKVSFYLAAGLPILCTPLLETRNNINSYKVAEFLALGEWSAHLRQYSKADWRELKLNVIIHRDKFYWSNLLNGITFLLNK